MYWQYSGEKFDLPQPPALFFSGKKPDPENPGKIRIWNFFYFWLDFQNGQ